MPTDILYVETIYLSTIILLLVNYFGDEVNINTFIKFWRSKAGIKQSRLAELAKVNQSFLSQMEKGEGNPSLDTLNRIAKALNISVGELIDGPKPSDIPFEEIIYPEFEEIIDRHNVIPVLNFIPDGNCQDWINNLPFYAINERIPLNNIKGEHLFAVKIQDNSMEPFMRKGDILVLNPDVQFVTRGRGRIGVVRYNDDYKIRIIRLTPDGSRYLIEPYNRDYDIDFMSVYDTTIFRIIDYRPNTDGMF